MRDLIEKLEALVERVKPASTKFGIDVQGALSGAGLKLGDYSVVSAPSGNKAIVYPKDVAGAGLAMKALRKYKLSKPRRDGAIQVS